MANSKLKIVYIMKMLMEKSDEEHPISIKEIIEFLKQYGISAERKAIYNDIESLQTYGLDIIKINGSRNRYYIGDRNFELPEVKLLVDAVQASRFITIKKSKELVRKLETLVSENDAKVLHKHVLFQDRIKNGNETIYYNVDIINKAILEKRQIHFKYYEYTVDKEKRYRRDGNTYTVSPYALCWANENYYLIGYYDRYNDISHFRVDRMTSVSVDENLKIFYKEDYKDFNLAKYSKKVFDMYSGETEYVRLKFSNELIGVVIDKFGESVKITEKYKDSFCIEEEVIIGDPFLGWLFMLGEKVEVLYPNKLKEKIENRAEKLIEIYKR